MKCPLILNKQVNYAGEYGHTERASFGDCIEGNCAWYDRENLDCSIRTIARNHHRLKMFFEGDDKWNVQNQ